MICDYKNLLKDVFYNNMANTEGTPIDQLPLDENNISNGGSDTALVDEVMAELQATAVGNTEAEVPRQNNAPIGYGGATQGTARESYPAYDGGDDFISETDVLGDLRGPILVFFIVLLILQPSFHQILENILPSIFEEGVSSLMVFAGYGIKSLIASIGFYILSMAF